MPRCVHVGKTTFPGEYNHATVYWTSKNVQVLFLGALWETEIKLLISDYPVWAVGCEEEGLT